MAFDWKRTEVWLGILLGLPGFIVLFASGAQAIAFIVLLCVALLIYASYLFNLPEFTVTEIEKTLIVKNKQGTTATLTRRQRATCNHKGVTEFWCGNIGATGGVSEFKIDRNKPHAVEEICGTFRICKRFNPPLKRGHSFDSEISYKISDSFLSPVETLRHSTDYLTKNLMMRVKLPASRKCKHAKAYTCLNQHPQRELFKPRISNDGREITLEVKKPKRGFEYVIEWEW